MLLTTYQSESCFLDPKRLTHSQSCNIYFASTCSGDIHGGEPEMVLVVYLSENTFRAVPKSAILTDLSPASRRLRELRIQQVGQFSKPLCTI